MITKVTDATGPAVNSKSGPTPIPETASPESSKESTTTYDSSKASHHDRTIGWRVREFVASCSEKLRPYLKWLFPDFVAVHYFYILFMVFLSSVMIYAVDNMRYIDALFLATSAASQSGLNTVDLNLLTLYQQIVLYCTTWLTSIIFVHTVMCSVRLYWFERHFDNIRSTSKLNSKMRRAATLESRNRGFFSASARESDNAIKQASLSQPIEPREPATISFAKELDENEGPALVIRGPVERYPTDIATEDIPAQALQSTMSTGYLSWIPEIGRNSTFMNLTDQQKEELGGVEYRALKLLVKILVSYYIGFYIFMAVILIPWIWCTSGYRAGVEAFGVEATWWAFFNGMSAFANLGFTLTPNSMGNFSTSPYALLATAFFIVCGNTGFPIVLRFIIWVMFKSSRDLSLMRESLGFLLDHPRRCFTILFPSTTTWWLLLTLVVLSGADWILFIVLEIHAAALDGLSAGQRVLNGIFLAFSSRTAGFGSLDLSKLHPAVQAGYVIMMYVSVLPIAISMRKTNVYEDQSLGVFEKPEKDETDHKHATSYIGAHLRKQLSFDMWFLALGVLVICIAEGTKIQEHQDNSFDIWRIIFEEVSAYGTVGLSLGFLNTNASFSAQFNVVSKLVIILIMIRGRHRGLPYSLDRAIMLPSKETDRYDMAQDLDFRLEPETETQGAAHHSSERDGSVLQFLRSVTPASIRNHFKSPSLS
ncbi:hypothetical protein WICPIJ_003266 [Wickerhamomyces pijperi]|uniref:Potassium transport protein n=1 Tax=Wickerhamomyces pijperi TaxID=599730 RepID=A0A9P8Q848_WICPI|nr:hypothetical protein WICPIJ_003266 [Wickerhamomyces pijperi]